MDDFAEKSTETTALTSGRPSRRRWRQGWQLALDLVFPPHCPVCGIEVGGAGALCAACWDGIDFIEPPGCEACGLPFEFDLGAGALCGVCARRPPRFERARAALVYNRHSRKLIIDFKHGDRTDRAPVYGRWLARAGRELIDDADIIAPVPLHPTRLFSRRYNQAALLAHALARECGKTVVPDLLIRRRRTPSQGRLGAAERRRNVRGAFEINRAWKTRLGDKRVLLIDDVMTTGATVGASAEALKLAGAGAVDVLTLARVVRPQV